MEQDRKLSRKTTETTNPATTFVSTGNTSTSID